MMLLHTECQAVVCWALAHRGSLQQPTYHTGISPPRIGENVNQSWSIFLSDCPSIQQWSQVGITWTCKKQPKKINHTLASPIRPGRPAATHHLCFIPLPHWSDLTSVFHLLHTSPSEMPPLLCNTFWHPQKNPVDSKYMGGWSGVYSRGGTGIAKCVPHAQTALVPQTACVLCM